MFQKTATEPRETLRDGSARRGGVDGLKPGHRTVCPAYSESGIQEAANCRRGCVTFHLFCDAQTRCVLSLSLSFLLLFIIHSWLSSPSALQPLINRSKRLFGCCPVSSVQGWGLGSKGTKFRPERSLLGCTGGNPPRSHREACCLQPCPLRARLLPSPPVSVCPERHPWRLDSASRAGLEQVLSGGVLSGSRGAASRCTVAS